MERHEIAAIGRLNTGKGSARKSRALGFVPGVLYGSASTSVPLSVPVANLRALLKTKKGKNTLLSLKFDNGDSVDALIKDMQIHPVSRNIVHVDFLRATEDREVEVTVPVVFEGRPEGVKAGGVLKSMQRTLNIRCLPKLIPEDIRVDISGLQIFQTLHVKDVVPPEGISLVYKMNYGLVGVLK